ncbi:MAG: hypothetical protein HY074_00285 [Deltaproteobacteria bacterium]|nr:hypothetical protein [Deltaproteobacteria bacterium]
MTRGISLILACAGVFALNTSSAHARNNIGIKAVELPAPNVAEFAAEAEAVGAPADDENASKRKPSGNSSKITGSEDLMSPELKAFRDKLVKTRHAEQLEPLLKDYNARYETLPNDLKYVVARLSPILPFRGFFWRMATLAHQAVITQEVLLQTIRAFAEQIMTFEPDAQWQAYMTFFSIPNGALLWPHEKGDGVRRPDQRFYVENDLVDFLATDVYQALGTAIKRLARLKTTIEINGKSTPLVFDGRIRFGENAFNQSYDAVDRFALIGDAERFAAMARFHRRMATISQLAAYNMNGNIALRKEIGKKLGIDASISGMLGDDALGVDGLIRADRVRLAKGHPKLFTLRSKEWMKTAYLHLNKWAEYLGRAWEYVQADRDNYDMLLDPDVFAGRHEQIDKAVANLKRMLPNPAKGGPASVYGAISGDELHVDLKSFFFNPPNDLKNLMPIKFNRHEDIEPLKHVYGEGNLHWGSKSTVQMRMDVAGRKRDVEWRNYLFGRATGWDPGEYSKLFPGVSSPEDVAHSQRILGETRGGRPLLNTLAVFVK